MIKADKKGFTLVMLQNRWDKCRDDVIELLQANNIPAHARFSDLNNLQPGQLPIDAAWFSENHIIALEQKSSIPHNKLKSRLLQSEH